MELITRFVAFFPATGRDVPASLADKLHAGLISDLVPLRTRPYLLAVGAVGTAPGEVATLLDVFPGTARSGRPLEIRGGTSTDRDALHTMAERETQSYNLIETDAANFLLESDAVGLKPFFVAEVEDGTLIASRIADMLALYPRLAAMDAIAVYELMVFRTPLARRTLHQGIRRGLPGARYQWSPERGLEAGMVHRLQPPPLDALAFVDETIARVRETVRLSLEEKTTGVDGPVVLALSGGFDSRLIAAVAVEARIPLRVVAYGRRHNAELHSARAIARSLGLKLESIEYPPDNSLRHLPLHLQVVEGNADLATVSIANLFAADLPMGTPVMHGFLGDPLAGSFCKRMTASEYRSADTLVDGIMRHHGVFLDKGLHRVLAPSIDPDTVRADVAATVRDDCPPYQAYLLWEFENRQRTYVGSHFALLGERFDTIMPFYDRRLIELWLSVPPIGVVDRTVFRKLLSRYYPRLARIPHSEEPAPIVPNLRWQLERFYRGLPKRALSAALGVERAHELFLRSYRDDYIWNLGNLAAPQQRAHMLSRVTALRPVLKEALGVELSGDYAKRLSGNVQALRGLFLAAEYARYRAAQAPIP